jgi:hypothetical protein
MVLKGRRFNDITMIQVKLGDTLVKYQTNALTVGAITEPTVCSLKKITLKGITDKLGVVVTEK